MPWPVRVCGLAAGGRRLWQGAKGYRATVLSGVVVAENDEPTGELPGRLIRGVQGTAKRTSAAA